MTRQQLGKAGEQAAARFLKTHGFTVVEQNYRTPAFEIDIIAKDGDVLSFVEVKTRSSLKKGLPRESILPKKQQKIILGATHYLKKNRLFNQRVRFDVVEVLYRDKTPAITLIKNAFTGEL